MTMISLEDQYAPTALGVLRLRIAGSGPPILLWPSLLMDGSMWTGVAAELAPRYRVILIDPPGHGASEALTQPFDFATCSDCIVDIIDALGIARVHYVGNSWGAMIGGTFAARYPDRIGAAILMNGTASPCGMRQRLEFQVMIQLGRLLRGIRGPLRARATAAFLGPTSLKQRPEVVDAVSRALAQADFRSVRWAVQSVVPSRPDQRVLFGQICSPVLVVAGAEDATFPIEETRAMAHAIPGASFTMIDDAAHLAGLECPAATSALIQGFIDKHGQSEKRR